MNAYLLDTHILLWWFTSPATLSREARKIIADQANIIYVSAAAVWELAIKKSIGRIDYPDNLIELMKGEQFQELSISAEHALAVAELPMHHQDPFDRIMIAQAATEDLVFISRDAMIELYNLPAIPG